MKIIRKIFLTGLVIVLPALVTIYVLGFTFRIIDSLLGDFLPFPGLGFLITIVLIFIVGLVATNVFGNRLIRLVETAFARLPVIKAGIFGCTADNRGFFRTPPQYFSDCCYGGIPP
jgi:uncharacterized membrane protein